MTTRREFLRTISLLGTAGAMGLGLEVDAETPKKSRRTFPSVKFGIIADIHRDLMPDADQRLETFMKKVELEKPDFLISLGDFCHPVKGNEVFRDRFAASSVPVYHTLGNHEMDRVSKKEAVDFFKMPGRFYSFDVAGIHCVVLDGNSIRENGKYIDFEKGNYFRYYGVKSCLLNCVDDAQVEWLAADLKATKLPTFLFSHQSLFYDGGGIPERAEIRKILERENEQSEIGKVFGSFNGHHHMDSYKSINGIHYFNLNSVSFLWHEEKVQGRFSDPALYKKYPCLPNLAPYHDALYSFVTITPPGDLSLKGVRSEWYEPAPSQRGGENLPDGPSWIPSIRDRNVVLS